MKNELKALGIILLISGLVLTVSIFQIPYCIGYTQPSTLLTPSFCVGVTVNLGFYLGILLIIIGVVVYLVAQKKRR